MTRHQVVVAVAGPDGAGKSSLATAMVDRLLTAPTLHLHHRPGVLPRSSTAKQENTEPHAQRPYSRWLSMGKLLYLWIDYQLGWWLRLRPMVRRGGAVVIERGWADIRVDPRRYRLRPAPRLIAILGRLLPRPDLVVVLVADAPTLLARVTELPAEEIDRQVAQWRRWAAGRPDVVLVDAALPQTEILDIVRRELDRVATA